MKIITWNVNGIRAVFKRGIGDWLERESPDILCLQETKVQLEQAAVLPPLAGYNAHWSCGERKGYSGVVTYTRVDPLKTECGLGIEKYDREGRIVMSEFPDFTLFNIYFPNGGSGQERLDYKLEFYDAFLSVAEGLREKGRRLVVCGDYNTAHQEIDLARPKANERVSGFLPLERAWLDKLVAHGYVDVFRHYNKEPGQYTWWDQKTFARNRNVGWRIDYFFVTPDVMPIVRGARILPEVLGSDHCPVVLEMETSAFAAA
ncbi:MAG: Exodeoxyribonuclease [Dehalococcoidia bacterium]|nr:Exodeoxyribonuclease [Dehalococcoidia bacterium]